MSMEIRPFPRKVRLLSKLTHEAGFKHMAINVLSNTEHFTKEINMCDCSGFIIRDTWFKIRSP